MRRGWILFLVGLVLLVAFREAYELTYEPAPAIRLRWRDGVGEERRAELERTYRLVDRDAPEGRSFSYVLMDTSRRNIEALVKDPDVEDTSDIDRARFEVPWATLQESRRFMWIADRTPLLRYPAIRWTIFALVSAMTVTGLVMLGRGVRWVATWRAIGRALVRMENSLRDG